MQGYHKRAELQQLIRRRSEAASLADATPDAGIVERHNFDDGHAVYELAPDDHHDHMVDVDTNDVIEFYDEVIEKRQHEIAEEQGFEIIDHSLVLYVRKKD